jgi:hypothetical protein
VDEHGRASGGELPRRLLAEPVGGARDEDRLVCGVPQEPYFLGASRFSFRFSFSDFCGAFFASFFGFSEPFM